MATCSYIMVIFGLLSVLGLAIGLRKAPYRQEKIKANVVPHTKSTASRESIVVPATRRSHKY